jgi:hypothetical protein
VRLCSLPLSHSSKLARKIRRRRPNHREGRGRTPGTFPAIRWWTCAFEQRSRCAASGTVRTRAVSSVGVSHRLSRTGAHATPFAVAWDTCCHVKRFAFARLGSMRHRYEHHHEGQDHHGPECANDRPDGFHCRPFCGSRLRSWQVPSCDSSRARRLISNGVLEVYLREARFATTSITVRIAVIGVPRIMSGPQNAGIVTQIYSIIVRTRGESGRVQGCTLFDA